MDMHQGHMPPPDSHPPAPIDTTTPADGIVTRFTQADWPRYANWLGARVSLRWPHIAAQRVPQMLMSYMGMNDAAIFKTAEAVSLVMLVTKPFERSPVAQQVFLFTNGHDARRDALRMIREQASWAKRLGASRLLLDTRSDYTAGRLKNDIKAKDDTVIFLELTENA